MAENRWLPIAAAGLALAMLGGDARAQAAPNACDTIPACIARVRADAQPGAGITDDEKALAERLQVLGPESVPSLLELLENSDADVRALAGFVLRDMPGLKSEHLPALVRAAEREDGWLPPAIASIGTPEAVRFLVDQLKQSAETHGQVTFALKKLGSVALPELLEVFRCTAPCDARLLRAVGFVLSEMGERAADAVEPLERIALEESLPLTARSHAVSALGGLHATARPAVRTLQELSRAQPGELRAEARRALVAIGGPGTEEALGSSLAEAESERTALLDIAILGRAGQSAGPAVEKRLGSDDADVRVAAARTLGFIEFKPAVAVLVAALDDADDWRLVFASAKALGQLQATEARASLEAVAAGHWYPPVRQAARGALKALDHPEPAPEARPGRSMFASEFFAHEATGQDSPPCADRSRFPPAPQRAETLDPVAQPALAEQLAYHRAVRSFGPEGEQAARRRTVPGVGLRIEGGWLLGGDQGEWGGELMFTSDSGATSKVLDANTSGLQEVGSNRIVAVTGLAHMGSAQGVLYSIDCTAAAGCSARRWKQLPGAPRDSWITAGGELLVNTTGGSVLVHPDGTMRMADCRK